MKVLFVHKNFPAQFGQVAKWLSQRGWEVTYATQKEGVQVPGLRILPFSDHREISDSTHHYLRVTEKAVITGQGLLHAAVPLRNSGYRPDIVVAHTGWGVGTFAKDLWPDTKYVAYMEWYYTVPACDRTPHDRKTDELDARAKARARNAPTWLDFSAADAILCPTRFQSERFPDAIRSRMTILQDGLDTKLLSPGPRDTALLDELGIPQNAQIITYLTRGMEPMRGFPEFMKAASVLQAQHPDLHVIITGEDRVAYGPKSAGTSWKERMLAELPFDDARLHFTGLVSRAKMARIMRSTDAHVYLTVPFVLSWSLRDAMACGAPIVASDVAPVREFISNEAQGLLTDGYDHDGLVQTINRILGDAGLRDRLGRAARSRIFDLADAETIAFPKLKAFLEKVAGAQAA